LGQDIVENFHAAAGESVATTLGDLAADQAAIDETKIFVVGSFVPATDRLLLKRLPPPKEGLIVKPQIAVEQSEYGIVIAIGKGVDVPLDLVAKFSRFSAEEIHFEDELEGDEYVLAYKHDIRGWFAVNEPEPSATDVSSMAAFYARD
jgi:co-chaperonin GroES (HSP10)